MKKLLFLLCLYCTNINSQEIISSPFLVSGVSSLGYTAQVQFTINQETVCDTYTTSWNVDYFSRIINLVVDYNYISTCSESFAVFSQIQSQQMIMTGIYTVNLILNVPTNPTWNRSFALGTISVSEPLTTDCDDNSIPALLDFCPSVNFPVCGCNGITYANECFAYLSNRIGRYTYEDCASYLSSRVYEFSCDTFYPLGSNFFERYDCSNGNYSGDEIFIYYPSIINGPSEITFTSSYDDVSLFLVGTNDNNIVCSRIDENGILDISGFENGGFYLIADRVGAGGFSINFCHPTSAISNLDTSTESKVYPNPASSQIHVSNNSKQIESIQLYDALGNAVLESLINRKEAILNIENLKGIHVLIIRYDDKSYEIKKALLF